MEEFVLGTKNYDTDWYLKYGLSYKDAAKTLREWGFSFIITQSKFLPMADSAVTSEATPDQQAKYATYDDLKFCEANRGRQPITGSSSVCQARCPGDDQHFTF